MLNIVKMTTSKTVATLALGVLIGLAGFSGTASAERDNTSQPGQYQTSNNSGSVEIATVPSSQTSSSNSGYSFRHSQK
jgi:hypothetical protein